MISRFIIYICLVLLFFLLVPRPLTYAHEVSDSTASAKMEYFLPYPGMLPGSAPYPLKALRDRITELLISDPGKKAEFYILQADKRMNASLLLLEQGKGDLSESTASKAEKYLERALNETEKYKDRGRNVYWILGNIEKSLKKHHEVLHELVEKSDGEVSKKFSQILEHNEKLLDRVAKLRSTE